MSSSVIWFFHYTYLEFTLEESLLQTILNEDEANILFFSASGFPLCVSMLGIFTCGNPRLVKWKKQLYRQRIGGSQKSMGVEIRVI